MLVINHASPNVCRTYMLKPDFPYNPWQYDIISLLIKIPPSRHPWTIRWLGWLWLRHAHASPLFLCTLFCFIHSQKWWQSGVDCMLISSFGRRGLITSSSHQCAIAVSCYLPSCSFWPAVMRNIKWLHALGGCWWYPWCCCVLYWCWPSCCVLYWCWSPYCVLYWCWSS